jgi:magnesium-transporting ATPase (P-type)
MSAALTAWSCRTPRGACRAGSTYFGRTTELVQIARPTLHAEALVSYLVRWLFVIVAGVVLVIVGLAIARGIPLVDMLPLVLALMLGAVPVALPVMLTVSMAVGAARAVRIRRPSHAIERDRGRRRDGCALRRQDGDYHVVLTSEGLAGIVTLVHEGRIVYQRVLTWIINKVSRTILKSAFVAIGFLVTGRLVMSALGIIVLVFLTDFVKITLSTDHIEGSPRPETWDRRTPVLVGAAVGGLMVLETLAVLWVGWRLFDLGTHEPVLQTFSFQMLFYFALFSIVSARERRHFWASWPSGTLIAALCLDGIAGTVLTVVGIPGLTPVPWHQTVFVLVTAMTCSLVINDFVKAALFRTATALA